MNKDLTNKGKSPSGWKIAEAVTEEVFFLLIDAGAFFLSAWPFFLADKWLARKRAEKSIRNDAKREILVTWRAYTTALDEQALGEARNIINFESGAAFDVTLRVASSSGLAVESDSYRVPRIADWKLDQLVCQLPGFAVGIAGPHGVGKSSVLRRYCPAETHVSLGRRDLSVLVSAPAEYSPPEFVGHLFAAVCRAILEYGESAGYLNDSRRAVDGFASPGSRSDGEVGPYALAAQFLDRLTYQATRNQTTGATVSLFKSLVGFSRQYTFTAAELPFTYPELVSKFRAFLECVAAEVSAKGGRVFIGIDELGRINDVDHAYQVINQLKGVLGVPKCGYLVAISDDILAFLGPPGLPTADALDEIIHVGYLRPDESRRLLRRRVIGMPDPFIWLCHCLSGGLPRDLIRTARHAVTAAKSLNGEAHITAVCELLVIEELAFKLRAGEALLAGLPLADGDGEFLRHVHQIVDRGRGPALAHGLAVLSPPQDPQADAVGKGDRHARAAVIALWAHIDFLRTLLDMFSVPIPQPELLRMSKPWPGEGRFDQLARIRQTLRVSTDSAMVSLREFRQPRHFESARPG